MNARMKGEAKQEFEQKKQGVNEDPWSTMTLNYSYIYTPMMKGSGIYKSSKDRLLNGLRNLEMMKSCSGTC